MISSYSLVEFVVDAKKHFFSDSKRKLTSSRPDSRDYAFNKYNYYFYDSCIGSSDFIGQEIVWENEKPAWGLNYIGKPSIKEIPDGFSTFMKEALGQVSKECPFRGPKTFEKDDFQYKCDWNGDFFNFIGNEKVYYKGEEIYNLGFQGGQLK